MAATNETKSKRTMFDSATWTVLYRIANILLLGVIALAVRGNLNPKLASQPSRLAGNQQPPVYTQDGGPLQIAWPHSTDELQPLPRLRERFLCPSPRKKTVYCSAPLASCASEVHRLWRVYTAEGRRDDLIIHWRGSVFA